MILASAPNINNLSAILFLIGVEKTFLFAVLELFFFLSKTVNFGIQELYYSFITQLKLKYIKEIINKRKT